MSWTVPALLAVVFAAMVIEAAISARHAADLRAMGGVEPADDVYKWMAATYPTSFVAMAIEGMVRGPVPLNVFLAGAALLVASKLLKVWVIATLGIRWTFRVIVPPRSSRIVTGPYRYMRHPNYLAVCGELVGMAVAAGALVTGPIAVAVFGMILVRRIAVEERALRRSQ
jgi:methyltransferase